MGNMQKILFLFVSSFLVGCCQMKFFLVETQTGKTVTGTRVIKSGNVDGKAKNKVLFPEINCAAVECGCGRLPNKLVTVRVQGCCNCVNQDNWDHDIQHHDDWVNDDWNRGRDCDLEKNIGYYGNNIVLGTYNKQPTLSSCIQSCKQNGRCNFFSYHYSSRTCSLKTRKSKSSYAPGFTSGSRYCKIYNGLK